MSDLHHECGIAAIYHLPSRAASPLCPEQGPEQVSRLIPRMLLDIQNRGQLSAGHDVVQPQPRPDCSTRTKSSAASPRSFASAIAARPKSLMHKFAGRAAIGHVRYATCGAEDRSYAQPFERQASAEAQVVLPSASTASWPTTSSCATELLAHDDNHLARDTDTEIMMHEIGRQCRRAD